MWKKKTTWALVIFFLFMGVVGWRLVTFQSVDTYVKSINNAGGIAMPCTDTNLHPVVRIVGRMQGFDTRKPYQVWLKGPKITDEWLGRHHYFRGMRLESLMLSDSSLSHTSIVSLIKEHEINEFIATQVPVTDADIKLLVANPKLNSLSLIQTQITDEALKHLQRRPVFSLGVAGTKVTPQGLLTLQNQTRLEFLTLDGKQLTNKTVSLLQALKIRVLTLSGPDVTDKHLEMLGKSPNLTSLNMHHTSVTSEGIAAFKMANPNCEADIRSSEDLWYQWSDGFP